MQARPLSWQNQQLAAELQTRQHILQQVKQTVPTGYQGYAKYLLSFAATIAPGTWLTGIHIKEFDRQIDLTGSAASSTAIMQFIQNMSKNPAFDNKTFNVLRLENSAENSQIINFTLSTNARVQNDADGKTP